MITSTTASAENFSIAAVPELVAGFVFGMTADNKLSEIEACMTNGELMVTEIKKGIADFKRGGMKADINGIVELGFVAAQIPSTLHKCKSMGDDISAIESWAAIFKDPEALVATVTKHYLFHK